MERFNVIKPLNNQEDVKEVQKAGIREPVVTGSKGKVRESGWEVGRITPVTVSPEGIEKESEELCWHTEYPC